MQADWIKPTHEGLRDAAGETSPEPHVALSPSAKQDCSPSKRPVWPLVVIAIGIVASGFWAILLAWLLLG